MGLLSFLFGLSDETGKKKKKNIKLEREMDAYELEEWEKEEIRLALFKYYFSKVFSLFSLT